ncbi:hypothetical protein M422DRAFT_260007, partial [Sphaerobolus stellatus SS14]
VLPGPRPSKIDSLVFASRPSTSFGSNDTQKLSDLRLFSTGGGSEVLEWDLQNGGIKCTVSSQGGAVWSLAVNPASTLLALGCEDGTIRILSLIDDSLTLERKFDRVKTRILSIAWGPPILKKPTKQKTADDEEESEDEDDEDIWADSWIVAGCYDSSIRKFNFETGRAVDRMTVDKAKGERTLVWAVGVFSDGTIVSGDSMGNVKFWDSKTSTQLQTFEAHGADVLCLTLGPEGKTVYTSGVDQKLCQFSLINVKSSSSSGASQKWAQTTSRRLHSHDVRAISVWPPYVPVKSKTFPKPAPQVPLLVSGGLDMSLLVCPCASDPESVALAPPSGTQPTFPESYVQRIPYSTGLSSAVQLAREARIIMNRNSSSLSFWKLKKIAIPGELGLLDLEMDEKDREASDWEKILDMELVTQTSLLASAISSNGEWVAASDLEEVKLWKLSYGETKVRPHRIPIEGLPSNSPHKGATASYFTSDNTKLVIGASMGSPLLHVVDLTDSSGVAKLLRTFEHHRQQEQSVLTGGSSKTFGSTITHLAGSQDGQWLASADSTHRIYVFNLDSVQVSFKIL